jgi:hypothetical protein
MAIIQNKTDSVVGFLKKMNYYDKLFENIIFLTNTDALRSLNISRPPSRPISITRF